MARVFTSFQLLFEQVSSWVMSNGLEISCQTKFQLLWTSSVSELWQFFLDTLDFLLPLCNVHALSDSKNVSGSDWSDVLLKKWDNESKNNNNKLLFCYWLQHSQQPIRAWYVLGVGECMYIITWYYLPGVQSPRLFSSLTLTVAQNEFDPTRWELGKGFVRVFHSPWLYGFIWNYKSVLRGRFES